MLQYRLSLRCYYFVCTMFGGDDVCYDSTEGGVVAFDVYCTLWVLLNWFVIGVWVFGLT